jgi:hypothetical protein
MNWYCGLDGSYVFLGQHDWLTLDAGLTGGDAERRAAREVLDRLELEQWEHEEAKPEPTW